MRIEIAGEGANARHVHPIGGCDLVRDACVRRVAAEGVAIAVRFVPARAIQVKRGETRVELSVREVFALFHDVTAGLGLTLAEVVAELEEVRRERGDGAAAPAVAAAPARRRRGAATAGPAAKRRTAVALDPHESA